MLRISLHVLPPVALLASACTFHRTEVPWHLRTGAEEPVVAADDATDDELPLEDAEPSTAAEEAPEVFLEEAVTAASDGMEPPEHRDADWSEPELVPLSGLEEAALSDPAREELGRVVDFLIDPEAREVAGLLAVSDEVERPAFVPFAGVVDHDERGLILTAAAAEALAADRREHALAALFRGRELKSYEGQIADVDLLDAEEDFRVFTLTDDNNQRHRVVFAPLSVTKAVPLEVGRRARLDALPTRDENGPFLVAAWIGIDDFELRLRDAQGRATWSRETPRGWSLTELMDRPVRLGDEMAGRVVELLVRFSDGQVESVRIVPEGVAESVDVPWQALTSEEGVGLQVEAAAWEAALEERDARS